MADAILATMDDPEPPNGRSRAADFAPSKITAQYLSVLLRSSMRPVYGEDSIS
jgi:hypothetical protein